MTISISAKSVTVAQIKEAIRQAEARLGGALEVSREMGAIALEGCETLGYVASDAATVVKDALQSDEARSLAIKAAKLGKVLGYAVALASMAALIGLLAVGAAFHWAYHLCEQWDSFAEVKPAPDPVIEFCKAAFQVAQVLLELLVKQLYGEVAEMVGKVMARAMAVEVSIA